MVYDAAGEGIYYTQLRVQLAIFNTVIKTEQSLVRSHVTCCSTHIFRISLGQEELHDEGYEDLAKKMITESR